VLASRRSSNASEKKRAKSSARSKSPFRSFRFKKKEKEKETGSGHYSDDEENYDRTIESGDGELEGMLVRKHEWESTTKKASNSSLSSIGISRRQVHYNVTDNINIFGFLNASATEA